MTEQTRDILITGASLLGGEPTDIALSGGTIVAIGADARNAVRDPRVIDAEGLIALPGLVDIHTHLRQPGGEDAETVFTGTRAAAVGGYTAVHAMANTTPTQDTAAIVDQVLRLGEEADWGEVRPVGAVTKGLEGKQLASLGSMARSRSKVRVFSDDGKCVADPVLMRRALEYVKGFDYHCAHTFYAFAETVAGVFGRPGEALAARVLAAFEAEYGPEMRRQLEAFATENFDRA